MEKRHTLNYEDDNHDPLKKKKKDDNHDIHGKKKTKKMQAGMLASKHVFNI